MNVELLNALTEEAARTALSRCCGSRRWVSEMLAARPFADEAAVLAAAAGVEARMGRADWLEAFAHHPQIGDVESLRRRFAATAAWSSAEQAGVAAADAAVLEGLAIGNRQYRQRFGHIFLVCATGKSASEMLALLTARLQNDAEIELTVAAGEQAKITRLRLAKL